MAGISEAPSTRDAARVRQEVAGQQPGRAGGRPGPFIDLCRILGDQTPNEADPNGDWYAFENGAAKLENPPILVVSALDRFEVHPTFEEPAVPANRGGEVAAIFDAACAERPGPTPRMARAQNLNEMSHVRLLEAGLSMRDTGEL